MSRDAERRSIDLSTLCTTLREVPRRLTDYTCTADQARREFGLGDESLAAIREAGLTVADEAGRDSYTRCDLHYVALRLGTASQYLWAIRQWVKSLHRFTQRNSTVIDVAYVPQLVGKREMCGQVVVPENVTRDVVLRHQQPAAQITATMCSHWPQVPPTVRSALADVAALDFCLLPEHLYDDTALPRRLGLSNCQQAARIIVESCQSLGHEARVAQGLLVGVPLSIPHHWAELNLGGTWTAVDPLMIAVMQRYGDLDRSAWPFDRPTGAMLARVVVGRCLIPLVSVGGSKVQATYLTKVA